MSTWSELISVNYGTPADFFAHIGVEVDCDDPPLLVKRYLFLVNEIHSSGFFIKSQTDKLTRWTKVSEESLDDIMGYLDEQT